MLGEGARCIDGQVGGSLPFKGCHEGQEVDADDLIRLWLPLEQRPLYKRKGRERKRGIISRQGGQKTHGHQDLINSIQD